MECIDWLTSHQYIPLFNLILIVFWIDRIIAPYCFDFSLRIQSKYRLYFQLFDHKGFGCVLIYYIHLKLFTCVTVIGTIHIPLWRLVHQQFHCSLCYLYHLAGVRLLDSEKYHWTPIGRIEVVVLCAREWSKRMGIRVSGRHGKLDTCVLSENLFCCCVCFSRNICIRVLCRRRCPLLTPKCFGVHCTSPLLSGRYFWC
jgi:hypothetical protein